MGLHSSARYLGARTTVPHDTNLVTFGSIVFLSDRMERHCYEHDTDRRLMPLSTTWVCLDNERKVFSVISLRRGKMLVSELERKLVQAESEGCQPFLVVATAGTTVLGAFDDIDDVADVCDRHSVWLHVDVSAVRGVYHP